MDVSDATCQLPIPALPCPRNWPSVTSEYSRHAIGQNRKGRIPGESQEEVVWNLSFELDANYE
jgi:hypothetical protein